MTAYRGGTTTKMARSGGVMMTVLGLSVCVFDCVDFSRFFPFPLLCLVWSLWSD